MDHAAFTHFILEETGPGYSKHENPRLGLELANGNKRSAGYRSIKKLAYDFKLLLSYLDLTTARATKTAFRANKLILQPLSKRFIGHVQNLTYA